MTTARDEDIFTPKGDGTGSTFTIPLSTTGEDGKAALFQVIDEKGAVLFKVDSTTSAITSAALVAPALGTPASGDLTNCTGLPSASVGAPQIRMLTETHTADTFTDGGAAIGTKQFTAFIPAGAILVGSMVVVAAGFAGNVSAVMTIGDGTDVDRHNTSTINVFATAATGVQSGVPSGSLLVTTTYRPVLTVTGASDFTSILAGGGSVTVSLFYIATV